MAAYVEVSFGSWALQIRPQDHLEFSAGNDCMVITNAALVTFREEGRSSLKLNFMKREDTDNGESAMLCSLMPRSVESVSLAVRLGRQETFIFENTGINSIDISGHYIGYVSVPGTANEGEQTAKHSHLKVDSSRKLSEKKRKREVDSPEPRYRNTKQVALKSDEVRKESATTVKGSHAKKKVVRQATSLASRKPAIEEDSGDEDQGEWEEEEEEEDEEDEDEDEEIVLPAPKKKKTMTARK